MTATAEKKVLAGATKQTAKTWPRHLLAELVGRRIAEKWHARAKTADVSSSGAGVQNERELILSPR